MFGGYLIYDYQLLMKKYVISGIPPSDGGVGRLMCKIVCDAKKYNYKCIIKKERQSIRKLINQKKFIEIIIDLLFVNVSNFIFCISCLFVRNSIIIFIHPQSGGFLNLLRLIGRNKLYLYVMDNSFFCIQSYNFDPHLERECCRCLGGQLPMLATCLPFPAQMSRRKNIYCLKEIKRNANNINFLAQNEYQRKMLQIHFGKDIKCDVVGMDTGEFEKYIDIKKYKNKFIVYHGGIRQAKGIKFFIEVAHLLSEYEFFIPASKKEVENECGIIKNDSNIVFKRCSWETGLKEIVIGAQLVVNPSLWSAPIEGALIKSILYNGNVATVKSEYGFENEICAYYPLLRLANNKFEAATQIRCYLKAERDLNLDIFLKKLSELNINLFDIVDKNECLL